MATQELQELQQEVDKLEALIQQYQQLFLEDGHLDTDEQQQLDQLQTKINTVRERLQELEKGSLTPEVDDPIKKRINYELLIELETYITVKAWSQSDLNTLLLEEKIELENDAAPTKLSIPNNSKVEVYTWARAAFIDANLVVKSAREILQKDYMAVLLVSKDGEFKLQYTKEMVGENNPKILKEYGIMLDIHYREQGRIINLQLDGFASAKQIEASYKNWDTREIKTTQIFKDQILKSISPDLIFEVEKKEVQAAASKELFFEKENQATLSNAQVKAIHQWWGQLPPTLQEQIKASEVTVEVIGYTSHTGSNIYNSTLGKKRAQCVGELLSDIIGETLDGKSIADINCSTRGEDAKEASRKVLILVKE